MFIVLGAGFFTTVFMGLGSGEMVTKFILGLHLGKLGTISLILGIIFILGFFMDWIGILLIFVPLSIPIVKSLGIDPLWFGTLFCTVITISCITPPFAYTAFYLKGIAPPGVTLSHIYRGLVPFIFMELLGLILIYIFPELCLWLPRKIM
jgi:TRAP-type mannitol/chloroaromatic compound transport system permease large subunit